MLVGQEIMDATDGVHYLESTLLTVPGTPYTAVELTGALFQISMLPGIKMSHVNKNAIRAIAFILSDLDMDKKVAAIAGTVMEKMDDQMKVLRDEAATITALATDKVTKITNTLKTQIAMIVESMSEGMRTVTQDMASTSAKLAEPTTSYRDALMQSTPKGPPDSSYTSTLNPKLRAREGI
jgi:hypothetical protein